ncbi:MAG: beta strand repeat-containing protein, partial [Paracoccaceae bacterium]
MTRRDLITTSAALALCAGMGWANDLPTGANVAAGTVGIQTPSAQQLIINQSSTGAVVNWDSFSVGQGARVDIRQPSAQSAILNRVTGNTTSAIHGQINANGQVHVVNPNGVFIGPNGRINTGGFVASTLDIFNDDFLRGNYSYRGTNRPEAVENQGQISIVPGGYAALIGGQVRNSGLISVPLGRVGLAAGAQVTLDFTGDQFLQVGLPVDTDDETLDALVENTGTIVANGGRVEMVAASARTAARNVVNMSGVIEARTVSGRSGSVFLGGRGGSVRVSGQIRATAAPVVDASPRPVSRAEYGGRVTVVGNEVYLTGATIEADGDGAGDGGLIRIGGDFEGAGPLPRAMRTFIDAQTSITADGGETGDGGRIAIWSDLLTEYDGWISARGGALAGDGGFAEVSGELELLYRGLADLRAPNGSFGTVLMDPTDYTVPGTISPAALSAQLELSGVTTDTTPAGPDEGNVILGPDPNAPITLSWAAETELFVRATNAVTINANITAADGTVTIDADGATDGVGTVTINPNVTLAPRVLNLVDGIWDQTGTLTTLNVPDFRISQEFFTMVRAIGGDGTAGNPNQITDAYGLQAIGSFVVNDESYILANDIDATGTSGWNRDDGGTLGWRPITNFLGNLNGDGFTVNGLTALPDTGSGGMFNLIGSGATVTNLRLTNTTVNAIGGGLLSVQNRGTIDNVSVAGTITTSGAAPTGGLLGTNGVDGGGVSSGIVTDSFSTAAVNINTPASSVAYNANHGGLSGENFGTLERSNATGTFTMNDQTTGGSSFSIGGLTGNNTGLVQDSYAQGNVSVTSVGAVVNAAGLVGENAGTINRSYSSGAPSITGTGSFTTGGMVATNSGTSSQSYWDATSSGQATSATGTSLTTAQFQNTQGFFNLAGWDFTNVWAPGGPGVYPRNYTTSPVIFAQPNALTVQYGQTSSATATGTVSGGASIYAFGPRNDTLDTSGILSSLTFASTNAGSTTFSVDTTDLTSTQSQVYDVLALDGSATITTAPLTVTANDLGRTYSDTFTFAGTEFTTTGLVSGDSVTSVTLTSPGEAANASVGSYAITPSNAMGSGLSNYTITYVNGTLTVSPAPLTITANDLNRVYGDGFGFSGTEFTASGLVFSGDSVDSVTLSSPGAVQFADVGSYAVTPSNAVGTGLTNYTITYVNGNLTVAPAALTITANDLSRVYGDAFAFAGTEFSTTGLVGTDTVDSVTLSSTGAAQFANVGSYTTTPSNPVGTGLANYTVSFSNGTLSVTPAPLTITADALSRIYGDTFAFVGTEFTTSGLLGTDSVDSVTLSSSGEAQFANVGTYATTATSPVGTGLANYTISIVDGSLSVTPAPLTITADALSRIYGDTFAFVGTEFTTSGLLGTDSVDSVTLSSSGEAQFAN